MPNSDDTKKKKTTGSHLALCEQSTEQTLDLPGSPKAQTRQARRLLSTDELHGYGFISTMRMMPSIKNADQIVTVYPREVTRGDEVILVPVDHKYDDPMEMFTDDSLRRGLLVGLHDDELHVCMHDEDTAFNDICFMIDNPRH